VVLPGDELPTERDLLTEATLPIEERGEQRRYTQVGRFNVFLSPGTKFTLPGPEISKLPNTVEGQYLILLRVEATDDREGDSNLTIVEAGSGVVHSGAVAGFPLPPLRYFIGSEPSTSSGLSLISPAYDETRKANQPLDFTWREAQEGAFYRLELASGNATIASALLPSGTSTYRAPHWVADRVGTNGLQWRVSVLDQNGGVIQESEWRRLKLTR
jgi:hypothetical protein